MSFAAYPSYQDSGLEWLGELPSHWALLPLKWLLLANDGGVWGDDPDGDLDTYVLRSTEQTVDGRWQIDEPALRKLSALEREKALLMPGDLVVTKSSGSALHIGKTTLVDDEIANMGACYSNFMQRLRPSGRVSPRLVWYFLNSQIARDQLGLMSSSTTGLANLNGTILGLLQTPLPPPFEQAAIAAFLDRETAKIDALVEEQRRLIELLKEKRQAVISHAVTKGLDPTVPMTDSGVEWLGEVPAHWLIRRIGSISTKITNGHVGPTRDILVESGVRYLQSLHVKRNKIYFNTPYFVDERWSLQHAKSILEVGDVLIVQTGDIGQVAVVPDEFAGCNCHALIIVTPDKSVLEGQWLGWVLNSSYGLQSLLSIQTGALHPHLNCGNVKDLIVAVPPLKEQTTIGLHINNATTKFDLLIEEAGRAVKLLLERRSALISAAVTGSIDVRAAFSQQAEAA